jgi:hypothetical protein
VANNPRDCTAHRGRTNIYTNDGDDEVNIYKLDGPTFIYTGDGADVVTVGDGATPDTQV